MTLTGDLFIDGRRVGTRARFQAVDPATGESLPTAFAEADVAHVQAACEAAAAAADRFRDAPLDQRAALLEEIAARLEGLGDTLLHRAAAESGLPLARLTGERARTCAQLRLFAAEVRDGAWQRPRIDPALPDRQPAPRPDLRQRWVPVGPVAVFGASNFPLAFSVAGGDTAAALAAGCPVVVKAHPAHPGASELAATAIVDAVAAVGLPAGTFGMVGGSGHEIGAALVADPHVRAVGFTGSRAGGQALMRIAAARQTPIPVYAEMSAVNPVLLLPAALAARAEALAAGFVQSLTLGVGQFCTNPGLVFGIDSPDLERFLAAAADQVRASAPAPMLTPGIHAAYDRGVASLAADARVAELARGTADPAPNRGRAALFAIPADALRDEDSVTEEVFGASSVVVRCRDADALAAAVARLEGQLTATLHLDEADHPLAARLLPLLEERAGRIIANGWPTGVEVTHAMVHGGPWPATSDGRSTSVGTLAIERFLRPVCYQDLPATLLPTVLRGDGPAGVPRRIDGRHVI